MNRTVKSILLSLSLLSVASLGRAATYKDKLIEAEKNQMLIASGKLADDSSAPATPAAEPSMIVKGLTAVSDNVQTTSLRHWSAVSVFDFKHDQWLAGAMTNLALVKQYALHVDLGYAQPIQNASSARGSVLFGASVHLEETEWFPRAASYLLSFVPLVPEKAVGLLQYTTVGGIVGYDMDRSIPDGGKYSFVDSAFYGIYIGLTKKFDTGTGAQ